MVPSAQGFDRLAGDPEQREHAALPLQKIERRFVGDRAQVRGQQRSHVGDPVAHRRKLLDPRLPQRLVRENAGRDRRTVVRRHRVDAARNLQHVTLHGVGPLLVFADGDDGAHALPVKAEILRVRDRDQGFRDAVDHQADGRGVLLQIRAEPLIRQIEKRRQLPFQEKLREPLPLWEG